MTKKFNSIDEYVNYIANYIEENPYNFSLGTLEIYYDQNIENSQALLEEKLYERIPNLIITHSDTDTKEDYQKQLDKIHEIYFNQRYPYFIDFSNTKVKKLEKTK